MTYTIRRVTFRWILPNIVGYNAYAINYAFLILDSNGAQVGYVGPTQMNCNVSNAYSPTDQMVEPSFYGPYGNGTVQLTDVKFLCS